MFKRLNILFILIFIFSHFAVFEVVLAQNNDEIYQNSFRPDIPRSMQDIPYDDEEYYGKHYSPYALISIPKTCKYDNDMLSPGFYLVKVFTENSSDYLLFKKEGVVVALVPVLDKKDIPKKQKKAKAELIEINHGDDYIVSVNFILNSYSAKLNVID